MPKFSIITINYNNLDGLKRTIESVVNQTWQEFEYIVIDGGSSDGSSAYIESQSTNIDFWVSESDKGIYNAMNKGIKVANGEYLLFLNSGDHFYDNRVLEKFHSLIGEFDLIYFDEYRVGERLSEIVKYPSKLNFSNLYLSSLSHPNTFINKNLFDKVGLYDESLRIVSDWKFSILALFKYNCTYLKVDGVLSVFYLDGISFLEDNSKERNKVLNDYFKPFVDDYEEFVRNRNELNHNKSILQSNRFKMLFEIEKTKGGMKIVSLFFRIYIIFFSKEKIKDVLN
ncbi:glycosyltransferase family 2 protein [Flavobacterium sp. K5-23]|uniref:glycosyltransferase family 2 protein n=1 Tax=Flavobacterium sp. K5-23 TaxID=2746225 RepID=UPI00200D4A1B|nr:glycosyltransferase family 2 protein [Flavobacterium sp. K5-23]UQD56148.1 glycosyltransferase [Flavobacterium sp. K5-23]